MLIKKSIFRSLWDQSWRFQASYSRRPLLPRAVWTGLDFSNGNVENQISVLLVFLSSKDGFNKPQALTSKFDHEVHFSLNKFKCHKAGGEQPHYHNSFFNTCTLLSIIHDVFPPWAILLSLLFKTRMNLNCLHQRGSLCLLLETLKCPVMPKSWDHKEKKLIECTFTI